jgi:hypothetical protein
VRSNRVEGMCKGDDERGWLLLFRGFYRWTPARRDRTRRLNTVVPGGVKIPDDEVLIVCVDGMVSALLCEKHREHT